MEVGVVRSQGQPVHEGRDVHRDVAGGEKRATASNVRVVGVGHAQRAADVLGVDDEPAGAVRER